MPDSSDFPSSGPTLNQSPSLSHYAPDCPPPFPQEWFSLLLAELLLPEYGLMEMQPESNTYWWVLHIW